SFTSAGLAAALLAPAGSAAAPSVAVAESSTGLYRAAAGVLGVAAAGAPVATFSAQGVGAALSAPDGSAAAPSIAFTAEPGTGLHRPGAGTLALAVGGATVATVTASGLGGALRAPDGSAAAPAVAFAAELGTGLHRPAAGTLALAVSGTTAATVTANGLGGALRAPDGSAGAPAVAFTAEPGTGLHRPATGTLALAVSGTTAATVTASGLGGALRAPDGSAAAPSIAFATEPGTGLHRPATGTLALAVGGTTAATVTAYGLGGALRAPDGSAAAPSVAFAAEPGTGLCRPTSGTLTFAVGGAAAATVTASGLGGALRAPDGSASAPAVAFAAEPGTGLCRPATGTLAFAVGGTTAATVTAAGLGGALQAPDGSASAPAVAFAAEPGTGLYRSAGSTLTVAVSGAPVASFTGAGLVAPRRSAHWTSPSLPGGSTTALRFAAPSALPSSQAGYLTYATSASLGDTWTVLQPGHWAFSAWLTLNGGLGSARAFLTKNAAATTATAGLTSDNLVAWCENGLVGTSICFLSATTPLAAGDVVRLHIGASVGTPSIGTAAACYLDMSFVGALS
ncbi:MAG TPA: hypothetical protein VNI01_16715, partial [Elusimicrobiota bacterium]|nr:hypothetical protein [Elusimicrobiota bacterium]